ncbi:MAG: formylglycine-generating enzyme family protein [Desulfobacteraceae bacterium]|nr:MAG: formylglycine-generating enzyme family protein [Desulfobacteraceae bacterium]
MTETHALSECPSCHEPVQATWRICPVCEARLQPLVCPLCQQTVKENWKRCPACEALLVCTACRRRLPPGAPACPHCAKPAAEPPAGAPPAVFTDSACGIEMVYVEAGSFQMGDTIGQGLETEQPVHPVLLDGFYIARYVVTQAQWLRLMPENPSKFQGAQNPVEQVTWDEARQFARLLADANQGRYHFDLPSEAQWEYAARGGGKEELYAGGDLIDRLAWYEANSKGRAHPVGGKAPNGLGLYDMSGNVWEWCLDTYAAEAYTLHAERNPLVQADAIDRVIRGGSWHLDAWSARCARRFGCARDFLGPGLGFRLVMAPTA